MLNFYIGIRTLETISSHSTLAELGLDSMMVTEVKQILDRNYQIFLTTREIRKLTFNKLKEMEIRHSQNKDDIKEGKIIFLIDFMLKCILINRLKIDTKKLHDLILNCSL